MLDIACEQKIHMKYQALLSKKMEKFITKFAADNIFNLLPASL